MEESKVLNNVEEIVETQDLTLGQNIAAYAIAGTMIIGVGTIAYFTGKGISKLACKAYAKISEKKENDTEETSYEIVLDDEKTNEESNE